LDNAPAQATLPTPTDAEPKEHGSKKDQASLSEVLKDNGKASIKQCYRHGFKYWKWGELTARHLDRDCSGKQAFHNKT